MVSSLGVHCAQGAIRGGGSEKETNCARRAPRRSQGDLHLPASWHGHRHLLGHGRGVDRALFLRDGNGGDQREKNGTNQRDTAAQGDGISLRKRPPESNPNRVNFRDPLSLAFRTFSPRKMASTLAAAVFALGIAGAAAQPAPSAAPPRKEQKKASQLISKQAPPKVSTRVLERATPDNITIHVSLDKQRAYLKVGDEIAIDTPVSTGKRAGMTPPGSYTILEKDADHRSSIYGEFVNRKSGSVVRSGVSTKIDSAPSGTMYRGAPMRWFMRLSWQGVGMHTGILPGYPASHGCVRLPDEIARMFYDRVKLGTVVTIGD